MTPFGRFSVNQLNGDPTTRQNEPFCLLLRTPSPDFSGLQGHKNTRTVDKTNSQANAQPP
jgi:hypothetical protein